MFCFVRGISCKLKLSHGLKIELMQTYHSVEDTTLKNDFDDIRVAGISMELV